MGQTLPVPEVGPNTNENNEPLDLTKLNSLADVAILEEKLIKEGIENGQNGRTIESLTTEEVTKHLRKMNHYTNSPGYKKILAKVQNLEISEEQIYAMFGQNRKVPIKKPDPETLARIEAEKERRRQLKARREEIREIRHKACCEVAEEISRNYEEKELSAQNMILQLKINARCKAKPRSGKRANRNVVNPVIIYQLIHRTACGPNTFSETFKMVTATKNRINEKAAEQYLEGLKLLKLSEEFAESLRTTKIGDPILMFNDRFFVVRVITSADDIPTKVFLRTEDRPMFREPPILEELIDKRRQVPVSRRGIHKMARSWPQNWPFEMVAYAFDGFWLVRDDDVPIPQGYMIPARAAVKEVEPPGIDYNHVFTAAEDGIFIHPANMLLYERRKAVHMKAELEKQQAAEAERNLLQNN